MKNLKKFNESIDKIDKVKSIHVTTHELDEYDQPVLNIETKSGKKYYMNLKSWNDFDSDNEHY